jgi:arylsulfatase A-like enzyme
MSMGLAGLMSTPGCSDPTPAQPPNVIFILADTLRADYLGTYGFQGDISPHLDALASESVVFDNCLSQAPWTKPSVASIITSTYPRVHNLTNHAGMFWSESSEKPFETGVLSSDFTTMAECFKELGYDTAGFVANPWITSEFGFGQGFDVYKDDETGRSLPGDIFIAAARDWLAQRDSSRPFFLYLHLMDVHDPFHAPFTDVRTLEGSASLGGDEQIPETPPWYLQDGVKSLSLSHWRSSYAANVRAFDRRLSFFLDGIRQSGLGEDSYLVFTSDHGEELHEHDHWAHGFTLQHHQVHVPLMIRSPGGVGGGRRVEAMVETIDLLPTLVSLVGGVPPATAQGQDLSSLLEDASGAGRSTSFASAVRLTPGLYALRTMQYSLILDLDTGETKLFDLDLDPGEQWDLAPKRPLVVKELRALLDEHLEAMAERGGIAPSLRPIDQQRLDELKALGYTR